MCVFYWSVPVQGKCSSVVLVMDRVVSLQLLWSRTSSMDLKTISESELPKAFIILALCVYKHYLFFPLPRHLMQQEEKIK